MAITTYPSPTLYQDLRDLNYTGAFNDMFNKWLDDNSYGPGALTDKIALFKGVGVSATKRILGAGGLDYDDFDWSKLDRTFQDTAGTIPADDNGELVGLWRSRADAPSHSATQATSNLKGARQATGIKFDGSDDNLLSDWRAQAGANCIVASAEIPSTLGATQVIAGVYRSAPGNGFTMAVTTTGQLRVIAGSGAAVTIPGSPDMRGTAIVVALTSDGSTVRAFLNSTEIYSAAVTGSVPTDSALRIGAQNIDGVASGYFSGSIKRIAFAKVALTLSNFQAIQTEWLAGL